MFLSLKRRLFFLALVIIVTFLWSGYTLFNLFVPSLVWQAHPITQPAPLKSDRLTLHSFEQGALLINQEPLFIVEKRTLDEKRHRVIEHYRQPTERLEALMPQLLNARTEDAERLKKNIQARLTLFTRAASSSDPTFRILYTDNPPLQNMMHLDNQGNLHSVAWWLGTVNTVACSPSGKCTLILTDIWNHTRSAWFSPDGGRSWQQLTQWRFPSQTSVNYELIRADDAGALWLADKYSLFTSDDQGENWQTVADIRPLLRRNNIVETRSEIHSASLSRLRWFNDNHQNLLADVSVSLPNRVERRFLFKVISPQQEQLLALDMTDITQSAQGEIFITRPSDKPTRYGLYQLQNDDTFRLVLEHIDRLGEIYAGKSALVLKKGMGDSLHRYISTDRGQNWRRYQAVENNIVFDHWHDRIVRLDKYHPTHYYIAPLRAPAQETQP